MYQEWFELFNKIKEEGKKQCMEGGWESEIGRRKDNNEKLRGGNKDE